MSESDAHEGVSRFAGANGINYASARRAMIAGDAEAGWRHLEYARDNKDKAERACVLTWLRLLAERGYPIEFGGRAAA